MKLFTCLRRRPTPRRLAAVAAGLALLASQGAVAQASASLEPQVRFETTAGDFVVELDTVRAPLTAENFLRYVRDGFYDGLVMHRVVPNFVVQGGGYDTRYAERKPRGPIPNESGNGLSNRRGTVGMARGESPHSATSQFYVNLNDNAGLDPLPNRWGYAVFGRVVEGMDVIDRIAHSRTGVRPDFGADVPLTPIVVSRARVVGEPAGPPPAPTPSTAPAAEPAAGEAAAGEHAAGKSAAGPDEAGEPAAVESAARP